MVELKVCIGSSCHLKGSYNLIQTFQHIIEEKSLHEQIDLKASFCVKQCQHGVSVTVDDQIHSVSPETAVAFFNDVVMAAVNR